MTILADNTGLQQIIQNNTLARSIGEALFPALLFRAAAPRELWEARAGQTMTFTNPGLYAPDTTPRTPGVTPAFKVFEYEHYTATACKYGWGATVDMPSNYVTAFSPYFQTSKNLALGAGQTMNRLMRNPLYTAYLAGHAIADAAAAAVITVNTLNGFRFTQDATSAFPVPVSNQNPIEVLVNGALIPQVIIGATPTDPNNPNGPGTLTFDAAPAIVAGDRIDTLDASEVIRPGAATTVDGITAGDGLTMRLVQRAIQSLRRDNIGPCDDGYYHVHFDPGGEFDIFQDNAFQRQIETRGLDDDPYLNYAVGRAAASTFFSNNEVPNIDTTDQALQTSSRPATAPLAVGAGDIGADVVNATGVQIARTIVMGGGSIFEKYVPESAYMSEAGISGKTGGMNVTNAGVEIPLDGIRFIVKAPTDLYNEIVEMAWSWTGDFVVPTNRLSGLSTGGTNAAGDRVGRAYKRARVIETALNVA